MSSLRKTSCRKASTLSTSLSVVIPRRSIKTTTSIGFEQVCKFEGITGGSVGGSTDGSTIFSNEQTSSHTIVATEFAKWGKDFVLQKQKQFLG